MKKLSLNNFNNIVNNLDLSISTKLLMQKCKVEKVEDVCRFNAYYTIITLIMDNDFYDLCKDYHRQEVEKVLSNLYNQRIMLDVKSDILKEIDIDTIGFKL